MNKSLIYCIIIHIISD